MINVNGNKLDPLLILTGTLTLIPGLLEILYGLTGETYSWGLLTFGGRFTLWRSVILLAAGALYLFAINQSNRVQKRAQAILASSMIWIVGGIEILSTVLNSITGGKGRWISSAGEFLSHYTGPFSPSILLLPITLLLVALIVLGEEKND